jgi:hypothetical protein
MSTDMSVYGLFAEPRELCELLHGEEPVQRFKIVECIHVFLILAFLQILLPEALNGRPLSS